MPLSTFYGVVGKNGESRVVSGEMLIEDALKIVKFQPLKGEEGLDLEVQTGMNRPVIDKRPPQIAKAFEEFLTTGRPIENGAVLLTALKDEITIDIQDIATGFAKVSVEKPVSVGDRQHTLEAYRTGSVNASAFPRLHEYVKKNTITMRFVEVKDKQEALRRTEHVNTGNKKPTSLEMFYMNSLNAVADEKKGLSTYKKERPAIVMFNYAYDIAKDMSHPLYDRLAVNPGVRYEAKKSPVNISSFVDAAYPLHVLFEELIEDYRVGTIEQQAAIVKKLTLPYWETLKSLHPNAFGDIWYNYNLLRRGMPIVLECYNALIRLYKEYKNKSSRVEIITNIKGSTIEDYASIIIPKFLNSSSFECCWKREDYWVMSGSFNRNMESEGNQDGVCKLLWDNLAPKNAPSWDTFVRSIQNRHHNRYENRKSAMSAETIKKRRKTLKKGEKKVSEIYDEE